MHKQNTDDLNDMALAQRLRALPAFAPPADGWTALQHRRTRRSRRPLAWGGGFALAASLLLALIIPLREAPDILESPPPAELSRLIGESRALESKLAAARPRVVVWDSAREQRVAQLQSGIALIDLKLNHLDGRADPRQAEALWRQRVRLMSQLVGVHERATPMARPVAYEVARVD